MKGNIVLVCALLANVLEPANSLRPPMMSFARRVARMAPAFVPSRFSPVAVPVPAPFRPVTSPWAGFRALSTSSSQERLMEVTVKSLSGTQHRIAAPVSMTVNELTARLARSLNYDLVLEPKQFWIELTVDSAAGQLKIPLAGKGDRPIGFLLQFNPHLNFVVIAEFHTSVLVDLVRDPYLFLTIEATHRKDFMYAGPGTPHSTTAAPYTLRKPISAATRSPPADVWPRPTLMPRSDASGTRVPVAASGSTMRPSDAVGTTKAPRSTKTRKPRA